MLMREWGLSVFTLRREPPPFIHPHGPSRCRRRRRRPACAFAPLRARRRGRGVGGRCPAPLHGAPECGPGPATPHPHSRPGASGRSSGAEAGEDGGGCSVIHVDLAAPEALPKDTCREGSLPGWCLTVWRTEEKKLLPCGSGVFL